MKSLTANRPLRVNLTVDPESGAIVSREDFKDRPLVDRIVGIGIAAHEGQLFGWPNQLLGLMTAMGLIVVSASGMVMWLRRRDPGALGAPRPLGSMRGSLLLFAIIAVLGVYLPLFGVSLLMVLTVERFALRKLPRLRDWLGLTPPALGAFAGGESDEAAEKPPETAAR